MMHMLSVFEDRQPSTEWLPSLQIPPRIHGRDIRWEEGYSPPPVYITSFPWLVDQELHLFGAKFSCLRSSERLSGFSIQYLVVCAAPNLTTFQLAQERSPVYQVPDCGLGIVDAAACKKKSPEHCFGELPKWKWNDAQWPTLHGNLMTFIGQVSLPQNKVTEEYLTYNETVFLFGTHESGTDIFGITEQMTNYQSIEEHYREEAMCMEEAKAGRKKRGTATRKPGKGKRQE